MARCHPHRLAPVSPPALAATHTRTLVRLLVALTAVLLAS